MCGIFVSVSADGAAAAEAEAALARHLPALRRRGPDAVATQRVDASGCSLLLCGSLLQLRGSEPAAALHELEGGGLLAFNGE